MATPITIDAVSLSGLRVIQAVPGQYVVNAGYSLLSGPQTFATLNQDVTASLDAGTLGAVAAAFAAVQAAIAANPLIGP